MKLGSKEFIQEIYHLEQKMDRMSKISASNNVMEHIGSPYLWTKIQRWILIYLKFNIIFTIYPTKLKIS